MPQQRKLENPNALLRANVARQALLAAGFTPFSVHKSIDSPEFLEKVAFNSNLTGQWIARHIQRGAQDSLPAA